MAFPVSGAGIPLLYADTRVILKRIKTMRRFAFSYFARVLLAFSTLFSFFRLRRADRLRLTKIPRPRERSGYPDNAITEVTSVQRFAYLFADEAFFFSAKAFALQAEE